VGTKTIFTPGTKVIVNDGRMRVEAVVNDIRLDGNSVSYRVQAKSGFYYWQTAEYLTEIKHEPKFSVGQDVVFVSSPKKNLHRVRERRYVAGGWEYMMFDGPTFYGEWRLSVPPVVPTSQPPRFQPGDQVRTPEGDKGTVAKCSTTYHDSSTWSTTYTVRRSFLNPGSIPPYTTREDGYAENELKPWGERTFKIGDAVRTPSGAVGTVETAVYASSEETTYVVKLQKILCGTVLWTRRFYENRNFKASELTLVAPKDCSYPSTLTSRVDDATRQIEDLTERVEALEVKAHSNTKPRFHAGDAVKLNGKKMEVLKVRQASLSSSHYYLVLDGDDLYAADEIYLSPWTESSSCSSGHSSVSSSS
jgi:hypothetical protein